MIRTILAAATAAVLLAGCASGGSDGNDASSAVQGALATVDRDYALATAAAAVYAALPDCATANPGRLCSNATVVAELGKARAVLDVAFAKGRDAIAAARDSGAIAAGIRIALDAVAVYAKVLATYDIKSG